MSGRDPWWEVQWWACVLVSTRHVDRGTAHLSEHVCVRKSDRADRGWSDCLKVKLGALYEMSQNIKVSRNSDVDFMEQETPIKSGVGWWKTCGGDVTPRKQIKGSKNKRWRKPTVSVNIQGVSMQPGKYARPVQHRTCIFFLAGVG